MCTAALHATDRFSDPCSICCCRKMSKAAKFYACEQGEDQSVESFANEIHAAWLELRLFEMLQFVIKRAAGDNYRMDVDVGERETELVGNFIWGLRHPEIKRELKAWFESFEWGKKPGFGQAKERAVEYENRLMDFGDDDIPDFDSDA